MTFSAKVYHQPGNNFNKLPEHVLSSMEADYGFNRNDPDNIPYVMREGSILIVENNDIVIFSQSDLGEPEDQTFGRNWSWVAEIIMRAYKIGRAE